MTKIAVITGAGSGIGQQVAIDFAKLGYRVIAIGRTKEKLEQTLELSQGLAGVVEPWVLDVGDKNAMKHAGFERLGKVDYFVACAGICLRSNLSDESSDDIWEQTMATNVDGVWYMFRALYPLFADHGRAVVISSGLGKLGREGHGAYVASKHAVLGLVKCFSKELAPRNITVNAVCPGWVDTQMSRDNIVETAKDNHLTPEQVRKNAENAIALKRFVSIEECSALILFLCSELAGAITGEAYNISGGEFFA
jgi:NAD(P)-dependent dehydrogenase (short-subunit alcohol dehydrogenase family)